MSTITSRFSSTSPEGDGAVATNGSRTFAAAHEDLRLDDFSFDFDDVDIPTEKLSDEDIQRRADEFMAQLLD